MASAGGVAAKAAYPMTVTSKPMAQSENWQ